MARTSGITKSYDPYDADCKSRYYEGYGKLDEPSGGMMSDKLREDLLESGYTEEEIFAMEKANIEKENARKR